MSSDSVHRIPKDQAQVFQAWSLPDIDAQSGRIISSEEKRRQDELAKQPRDNEAIEEVEEIVHIPTAQEVEAITQQAHQEGYQAGYEEGLAKAKADGLQQGREEGLAHIKAELEPELHQQIDLLQQLSLQLSQAFKDQESLLQPLILQMVENLSRQFIGRALAESSEHLLPLIQQAVKVLPAGSDQIVIECNAAKPELLQEALNLGDIEWRLQENRELSLGSCKIKSQSSVVEIDMAQRLEQLFQQFCAGQLGSKSNYKPVSSNEQALALEPESAVQLQDQNPESNHGLVTNAGLGLKTEQEQSTGDGETDILND